MARATAYEIHPSVGVARVGDSDTEWFIGPEPGEDVQSSYRARDGRLKRQGARFRVFACRRDERGLLLDAAEVTAADATIAWSVHLANRKAAGPYTDRAGRRNQASGVDARDSHLIIDPGQRTLAGPADRCTLDSGTLMGHPVDLGEAWVDEHGRLVVLGGRGCAGSVSPDESGGRVSHFADNDGWFDDVSDGPIRARIALRSGRAVAAKPAWLVVMPPDYAPGIRSLVTWYDVAQQAAIARGWRAFPERPSFQRDIRPLLTRLLDHQWVNRLFRRDYGAGGRWDFAASLEALADPTRDVPLRREFVASLRNPTGALQSSRPSEPKLRSSSQEQAVLALTPVQYVALQKWAEGRFIGDLNDGCPVESLPDALDRASLESCIGAALCPGLEVGRIIRDPFRYSEPLRLDAARLRAGQLTECGALPWHADFYTCRFDGHVAWWPSHRPDHVFASLKALQDEETSDWDRGIADLNELLVAWSGLGIVTPLATECGQRVHLETERRRS